MLEFERNESYIYKNNFLIHRSRPEYEYYHTVWHFTHQRYREIIDKNTELQIMGEESMRLNDCYLLCFVQIQEESR